MAPPMKTHCKRGHLFTPANTRFTKLTTGYKVRSCKRCRSERDMARYYSDPVYQAKARARANTRNRLERNVGVERLGEG